MSFVFSFWYFVIIALIAGIVACLVIFFKMDKKDSVLIDAFINSQQQANTEQPKQETIKEENKTE